MKNNKICIFGIVIFFILLIWFYITHSNFNPPIDKDEILLKKINELELKIDALNNQKDSIRMVIDSTHVKIITNEKHYQERVNTIISQPDSFSESFTRQYLRNYATTHGYSIRGTSETK